MTKSRIKICLLCALSILCVLCFTLLLLPKDKISTSFANEIISSEVKEEYLLDSAITLPETVEVGGEQVSLEDATLVYPNGKVAFGANHRLDQLGSYQLKVVVNGVVAQKSFTVKGNKYKLPSRASTATYYDGETSKWENSNRAGIGLHLYKGEEFVYNQIVNLNDLITEDNTIANIIQIVPRLSDNNGNREITYATIKMVDAYDPSIYVEYVITLNSAKQYYMVAGANGEYYTQFKEGESSNPLVKYSTVNGKEGYYQRYNKGSDNGTYYQDGYYIHGYMGTYVTTADSVSQLNRYGGFTLSYDVKKNQAYVAQNKVIDAEGNVTYQGTSALLTDLDDPNAHPDFKGFTTGEVYLQIQPRWFHPNVTSADMQILSIFNMEGEDLQDGLVSDSVAPVVNFDFDESKPIRLCIGKDFVLPMPECVDVNPVTVSTQIFYDFGMENNPSAGFSDGVFNPSKAGKYLALYSVVDSYGNKTTKEIKLEVGDVKPFIFNEENKLDKIVLTKDNFVPYLSVNNINGGANVSIAITKPNGTTIDITNTLTDAGYKFFADTVGEYTISYNLSDVAYNDVFSYKITAVSEGDVLFNEALNVPSYFIKDATYDLGVVNAKIASENGLKDELVDLYVKADGADYVKVNDTRNYVVTATESLQFKVKHGEKEKEYDIIHNVVDLNFTNKSDVNKGQKEYEKYFQGYDDVTRNNSYFNYIFDGTSKEERLTYINALAYRKLSVDFEIPKEQDFFSEVSIEIRALGTVNEGIVATYYKTPEAGMVGYKVTSLDGKETYCDTKISASLVGTRNISIIGKTLVNTESITTDIPDLSNAYVEMSFVFKNVTNAFNFRVRKILNQTLTTKVVLNKEVPFQLAYYKEAKLTEYGTNYTLPEIVVSNAFYPVLRHKLLLTLTDAQRNTVKDVTGKTISSVLSDTYTFKLTSVGLFSATFKYNDGKERKINDQFTFNSIDTTPCTIAFDDGFNESTLVKLKVGSTHTIKGYTVTDNYSEEADIYHRVYIVDESNSILDWDVAEYKFNKAGYYKILVYTFDGSSNVATSYYNVLAE